MTKSDPQVINWNLALLEYADRPFLPNCGLINCDCERSNENTVLFYCFTL